VPQEFLPKLIALHEQGKFPYEKIVTPYDFKDINQAIADIKSGAVIKAVLLMPDE
jgi:aryl-alcohol dehydrogenase